MYFIYKIEQQWQLKSSIQTRTPYHQKWKYHNEVGSKMLVNWVFFFYYHHQLQHKLNATKNETNWKKRQTDLTLVTSEVKVTSGRWIVLLAVTGGERDPHHPFSVSTGQPPLHVVLVPVQFPSAIVVRNIRDFPHPWQGVDGTFRARGVVLLKMHMHFLSGLIEF